MYLSVTSRLLGTWFGYVPVETNPGYVRAMRLFGLRLWRGSAPFPVTGDACQHALQHKIMRWSGIMPYYMVLVRARACRSFMRPQRSHAGAGIQGESKTLRYS